ncbi:MAG TPA: glycosyltransferase family 39 protein [Coleofasciculaceae cyanobacterium]
MKELKLFLALEILLISAIALAVMVRVLNLSSQEFWYDEVVSLLISGGQKIAYRTPGDAPVLLSNYAPLLNLPSESGLKDVLVTFKQVFMGIVGGEPHPPLFYLSQHVWLRLFGNAVAQVRSLGFLLSLGAIFSAYGLGRSVLGHRGGLILSALLATNPFYLFHSLNVRMYGPLVLWATLSGWAMLSLIALNCDDSAIDRRKQALWNSLLVMSVAGGFLTFYFFAYWAIALGVLVLYLDRRRWWQYGISLGLGFAVTIPWLLWGTRQQVRNADLNRFSESAGLIGTLVRQLQDVLEVLGVQLLSGGWATAIPDAVALLIGLIAATLLLVAVVGLWQNGDRQLLGIAFILGILPLLLTLGVDLATGKSTLGWGYGRSVIFMLPGCLLLLAAWLERATVSWQKPVIAVLLALYLGIGVGDYTLRSRQMFHTISAAIQEDVGLSTLVVMNSKAWGHILRLAYYVDPKTSVSLLAEHPNQFAPALDKTLASATAYDRIFWLDPKRAVWGEPKTEVEKQQLTQAAQDVLQSRYKLVSTEILAGTMDLDQFTLSLYKRSPVK